MLVCHRICSFHFFKQHFTTFTFIQLPFHLLGACEVVVDACLSQIYIRICSFHFFKHNFTTFTFIQLPFHLLGAGEVVVDAWRLQSQRPLHHQTCVPLPLGESIVHILTIIFINISFWLISTSQWDTGPDDNHSACKPPPPQSLPPTAVSPGIHF